MLKSLIEGALVGVGLDRVACAARRRRSLVLAYHNIVPAGGRPVGERSLHLPQDTFAAQLDALAESHDVVPLADIDEKPRDSRPRAIITFDDAYRGAVSAGIEELQRRSLPATIFVAPGLFGTTTWWDRLAHPAAGELAREVRAAALSVHAGSAQGVVSAFGPGTGSLPAWAWIANEDEVRAAAARPGITLGSHTWSHPNLTAIGPEDLASELERPLEWLADFGQRALRWLAYPYGLTSPAVARAAADAGYAGAFRIDGGWMPARGEGRAPRHDLPRLNVPSGLSAAGFRLRAAGLLTG